MNFTHLAAFFAVVETGSVTAASKRMHVSQPALTREIRELEERVGVSLFDRLPRGMHPTEAGELLARYAAQIFSLANAAEMEVGEFAGLTRGHLRLAASRTIGTYLLPSVISEFQQLYPAITIELAVLNTEHVEEAVLMHDKQLGLIEGPHDEDVFDAIVFSCDELIVVADAKHPLARKTSVSAAEVGRAGLVMREPGSGTRTVVENAYAQHGFELIPKLAMGSSEAIKRMLRFSDAVAWVSRHAVADELAAGVLARLHVRDLKIERNLSMIWHKSYLLSPSVFAFRQLICEAFECAVS